nr:hypothetical protein [Tanacetum cinerariifolium]
PTVGHNFINSTNPFSAAGPSNPNVRPTYEKSSFIDASILPNDPDMLDLEDITYSDDEDAIGAEANHNNLESFILVSHILTTRIHKDHPVLQIIGDLSITTQTRSMTRAVKDQDGLSQMFDKDFYTCMFACFLSQEEPKRIHQALKDTSWIEAMQEELLQFKMQKVWVLVDLPYGKRAIELKWYSIHHGKCPYWESKNWLVQKQTALGKDNSNLLMADNLPKIVWYSTHHITLMKSWLVQKQKALGQTTTGKEISNPFMAGFNTPRSDEDRLEILELTDFVLPKFWNTVTVKQSNDVTRLQALVDIKKVVLSEAVIRLRLNNAKGVDCLPNKEIFAGLARIGYEKPSIKLTFYKAFFSSQWKFLIHTILQSMSAKRTSWNDFRSVMASAVICLSTGKKFNFSKYIFESLVRNVNSSSKFYMYPRFIQLIIQNQIGVETPLFEGILVVGENVEEGIAEERVQDDAAAQDGVSAALEEDVQEQSIPSPTPPPKPHDLPSTSQAFKITKLKKRVKRLEKGHKVKVLKLRRLKKVGTSQRINTLDDTIMDDVSNQGRMIDELDKDKGVALMGEKEEEKKTKKVKDIVGDDQVEGRQAEIQAKIYQIDMDHTLKVLTMQEDEPAEVEEVVEVVTTAKLITEVVTTAKAPVMLPIQLFQLLGHKDPEEESTKIKPTDTKSKDKGKGKMVEAPKSIKKNQQVELDEEYPRKLHEELSSDIDWDTAIEHVKQKAKESKEQIEEEERRAIESINKTPAHKATKRKKLNEEVVELNKHLEIVPDEDDDVFTEATPLARKVPIVDYLIIHLNNKPHYKIVKANGTHQLYVSFLTLLKNFDRDDLESLWSIVKERFSITKPDNFTDDFLLTTLGAMFEKADDQA